MATPSFIHFSRFQGKPIESVIRVEEQLCRDWGCRLREAVYLRPSSDPYSGGLERDGEFFCCERVHDVEKIISEGRDFGLVYSVPDIRSEFSLVFHDFNEQGYTITGSVESNLVSYKEKQHYLHTGEWFEGWLISLVDTLDPKVCAYGNTMMMEGDDIGLAEIKAAMRRPKYIALEPNNIVEKLIFGDLLELPYPVFHAISKDLIGGKKIKNLIKRNSVSPNGADRFIMLPKEEGLL